MPIPKTLNQPIAFSDVICTDNAQAITLNNTANCPGIDDPNFASGVQSQPWIIAGTLSIGGWNPLQVTGIAAFPHIVSQTGVELTAGTYQMDYSAINNDAGQLIYRLEVIGSVSGSVFGQDVATPDGPQAFSGTETFTVNPLLSETYTVRVSMYAQNGTNPTTGADVNLVYLNICGEGQAGLSLCFQFPLFEVGDELLQLSEVNLDADFTNTTTYNNPVDDNGSPTACGTPFNDNTNPNGTPPTAANVISGTGRRFHEVTLSDVTIDYGLNIDDDTARKLQLSPQTSQVASFLGDDQDFTASDADSTLFWLGTNNWNASSANVMEMYILAKSECDDTNERVKHDITMTEYAVYPAFYETTYTATDDTFYRLKFDLAKTTNVTVDIKDSGGSTIFEASETGPTFDKIFDSGTLPVDKTVTVRFEIGNLTEWPATDFEQDVLTNISLYKMCKWNAELQDENGTTILALTETHATQTESVYTSSYNKNILYCLNMQTVSEGCYYIELENNCDTTEKWLSNQFNVCADSCNVSKLSWDHGGVKYIGSEDCLDYVNYDYDTFFFVKIDFQDLTQEWEGTYYRDARYGLRNPYSAYANTQVMQVWPLPAFMRKALGIAISSVFTVDGVQYRKLDDESITPQFNAQDPSPTRILVQRVDDTVQSKNL